MSETVALTINGKAWGSWSRPSIRRSIDRFSEVSFDAPFEWQRREFRETFRPFSYGPITVSVSGEPIFDGVMVSVDPGADEDSRTVSVSCYASPAKLERPLPASAWPIEFNGLTLQQIAERVCEPFGVVPRFDVDNTAQSENDAYRAYLGRLRRQRRVVSDLEDLERVQEMARRSEAFRRYDVGYEGEADVLAARVEAAKSQKRTKDVQRLQDLQRRRAQYDATVPASGGGAVEKQAVLDAFDAQIAAQRSKILTLPGPPMSLDTPFRRVALKPDQSAFDFLAKLAKQRNFVLTDSVGGELLFWRSIAPGAPRARFVEGQPPLISVSATFAPQDYFSEITGIAKTRSGKAGSRFTVANPFGADFIRPDVFSPDDTDSGDLEQAVRARMGRMFAGAASYTVTVPTWRDASGEIWRPNTTVTLNAPGAMVYRETEMVIRDVTFDVGDNDAQTATLSLVLPGAFSGEIPEVLPWD